MLARDRYIERIKTGLARSPVVALLGPRQCGKTTLANIVCEQQESHYFDLENYRHAAVLQEAALTNLESLRGLIVLDEIQRQPELFEVLRVLADRDQSDARFLVLGSASPTLVRGASETLAGRVAFVDMTGFDITEIQAANYQILWTRGGFPPSYLSPDDTGSFEWRQDFIRTFLERDIALLGISINRENLRRFWIMVAHYHGQRWNAAEFAQSMGCSEATARRYLDCFTGAYMVRQLQPWHENLKKRQVKSPKIYIRDSGILHALLSLQRFDDLISHPKVGPSWEGFVIEQISAITRSRDLYFWASHGGAELDLLLFQHGKRLGIEIKYTDAPRISKSMHITKEDLNLDRLYVVYPGVDTFELGDGITALSLHDLDRYIA